MTTKFITIDRQTPLLLPADLRDWVKKDHLVHFIIDAVEHIDGKRLAGLSITHNSSTGFESECDVSESGEPAPQNYIAWRRIARPSKVAAKSGNFYYIVC